LGHMARHVVDAMAPYSSLAGAELVRDGPVGALQIRVSPRRASACCRRRTASVARAHHPVASAGGGARGLPRRRPAHDGHKDSSQRRQEDRHQNTTGCGPRPISQLSADASGSSPAPTMRPRKTKRDSTSAPSRQRYPATTAHSSRTSSRGRGSVSNRSACILVLGVRGRTPADGTMH
jgi:hypothetical protein